MSKRLVVVLCIAVALVSFIGGAAYKYEDYRPVTGEQWLEDGTLHTKFTAYFTMPVDTKTAYIWLDFVTNYHQYCIDNGKLIEDTPVELHQAYIDLYGKIKALFREFGEEWGVNE